MFTSWLSRTGLAQYCQSNTPLFAWLVEHVSDILNRFLVGRDGNTAVQRMKRKRCEQYVLEFGSAVMFRVCGKVEGARMSER